jgi:hypothetical protein
MRNKLKSEFNAPSPSPWGIPALDRECRKQAGIPFASNGSGGAR